MSEFAYVVGDTFEGGPIELQKYIHEILSVGGEFEYAGNLVTLIRLPDSVTTVDEIVANTIAAIEATQPVIEDEPEEVVVPAPEPLAVDADGNPDLEVAVAPAPKRGRRPAVVREPIE